jgi:O-antigen/teichoic acid export membrane protein
LNAGSLFGTTAVTSVLGFVFWSVAARLFPAVAVGDAAAYASATMLLGSIASLGLGTLLVAELPRHPGKERSLVVAALAAVGVAGTILAGVVAIIASRLSPQLATLIDSVEDIALFATGVALTAIASVLDQVLVGVLRGGLQFTRNTVFSAAKLVLLVLVGVLALEDDGSGIYATWVVGIAVSLALMFVVSAAKRVDLKGRPDFAILRTLAPAALSHHGLNLTLQAPGLLLPLLVTAVLTSAGNAYFYIAWMTASLFFAGPGALATVLFAVGVRTPGGLETRMRFTIASSLAIAAAANVGLLAGGQFVLGLFGRAYAENAGETLRLFAIAMFPLIVKNHYVAVSRVRGRTGGAAVWLALGGLFELVLAGAGAQLAGLTGVALGWLAAQCVEALLLLPWFVRTVRGGAAPPLVTRADTARRWLPALRDAALRRAFAASTEAWFIAIRRKSWTDLRDRPEGGFDLLLPPKARSYADPFILKHRSVNYVLFEDFDVSERRGVIAAAALTESGAIAEQRVVLSRPYHLSYPFVFESGGEIFMLPETSANRTVDLYRAIEFPWRWTLERRLMSDVHMVDSTIVRADGRYWLFGTVSSRSGTDWDELHLFFADDLLGAWRPHPRNPVVSDRRRARSAGRLFLDGGRLIRPGQDCSIRYGRAISLNRVDVLSDSDYRETVVGRIGAEWLRGNRGTHSIDHNEDFEVVDGRFMTRRPFGDLALGARRLLAGRGARAI